MAYYTAGVVGSYFRGAVAPNGFDISGSTVSATNLLMSGGTIRDTAGDLDISGSTIRTSNFLMASGGTIRDTFGNIDISESTVRTSNFLMASGGTIRDTFGNIDISESTVRATNLLMSGGTIRDTAGFLDISGGNLTVAGIINAAAISTPGIAPTNIVVPGYIRDTVAGTNMDISGGNIRIAGRITGSTANTSNQIGGVTLSNFDICLSGTGRFLGGVTVSNQIGGVTMRNFDVCLTETGRFLGGIYSSNSIGGVTLDNGNISNATSSSNSIAGIILSNNTLSNITNTSNDIGGITLSNNTIAFTADTGDKIYWISGVGSNGPKIAYGSGSVDMYTGGFSNDSGTFRFLRGSAIYGWAESMRITSDGRVGIGTPTPNQRLDVVGGNIMTDAQLVFNSDDVDKMYLTSFAAGGSKIAHSVGWSIDIAAGQSNAVSGQVRIMRGGASGHVETARFDVNGRLGIGCNAPQNRLDMSMSSSFDGIRMTGPTPAITMYVRGSEAAENALQFSASSTRGAITQFDGTRTLNLNTGINNTPRLVVGTNGNIAIGANHTNPELALDVSAANQYTAAFRSSGGGQAGIWVVNGAGAGTTTGIQMYQNTTGQGLFTASGNAQPMHFWTNGAIRASITSAGNVGIGTVAPTTTLDISSSADPAIVLRNRGGNATIRLLGSGLTTDTCGMQIFQGGGEQGININNASPFHIQNTSGTKRLTVTSAGNVGIGTVTPGQALDVSGILRIQRVVGGNNNLIQLATISNGAPVVRHGIAIDNDTGGGAGGNLYFNAYNDAGGGQITPLFIERSSGDIGIGTQVLSNYRVSIRGSGGSNGVIAFHKSSDDKPYVGIGYDQTVDASDGLAFFTNNASTDFNGTAMFINRTNRRVGIGTTVPAYLLDVNGTMAANSNEQTVYVTSDIASLAIPTGFTMAYVTLVGGGGGGGLAGTGGVGVPGGGGGGGAGYRVHQLITSPSTMTITLGAGGIGASAGAGGASTLAYGTITVSAPGGRPGLAGSGSTGGAGGAGDMGGGGGGGGVGTGTVGGAGGGLIPGAAGTAGTVSTGGNGGSGAGRGGSGNGGSGVAAGGGGGGGGGPLGGIGSSSSAGTAGGIGCGGGGASASFAGTNGGGGYAIIRFLR